MLETLAQIYDVGSKLVRVTSLCFEGNPNFITAIGLQFDCLDEVCIANPDDDTLTLAIDVLTPEPDTVILEQSDRLPWSSCIGRSLSWGWRLTNQQGYTDGLRLEWNDNGDGTTHIIELIVVASCIEIYESLRR